AINNKELGASSCKICEQRQRAYHAGVFEPLSLSLSVRRPPMPGEESRSIIIAVASGLVSLVAAAMSVLNFLLTRRKTRAEIDKLQAETKKIQIELTKDI